MLRELHLSRASVGDGLIWQNGPLPLRSDEHLSSDSRVRLWRELRYAGLETAAGVAFHVMPDILLGTHPENVVQAFLRQGDEITRLLREDCTSETSESSVLHGLVEGWSWAAPPFRLAELGRGEAGLQSIVSALAQWMLGVRSDGDGRHDAPMTFFVRRCLPPKPPAGCWVVTVNNLRTNGRGSDILRGLAVTTNSIGELVYLPLADWFGEADGREHDLGNSLRKIRTVIDCCFSIESFWRHDGHRVFDVYSDERTRRAYGRLARELILSGGRVSTQTLRDAPVAGILQADESGPSFSERGLVELACGIPGGSRLASGRAAVTLEQVARFSAAGERTILLCEQLEPSAAPIFAKLSGLVMQRAGPASHIAVMAHSAGVATLTGVRNLRIDAEADRAAIQDHKVASGKWITIDEASGRLFEGNTVVTANSDAQIRSIIAFGQAKSGCRIFFNASDENEAGPGFEQGGSGVGLCRSEVQIFRRNLIKPLREHILSWLNAASPRSTSPDLILGLEHHLQGLLRVSCGRVVNYRLIDASLHEIWHSSDSGLSQEPQSSTMKEIANTTQDGGFGLRGPRWALLSGFYHQQIDMAVRAATRVVSEGGSADLIITVPSVSAVSELLAVKSLLDQSLTHVKRGGRLRIRLGVMVETVRAALLAGDLASWVDVICFGLNDLTQSVWALGRESSQLVYPQYRAANLMRTNPFLSLDKDGVFTVLQSAINAARTAKPAIEIFFCGEQTSDDRTCEALRTFAPAALSCHVGDMAAAALSLSKVECDDAKTAKIGVPEPELQRYTADVVARLTYARQLGLKRDCERIAMDWADTIGKAAGVYANENWKIFKRDLVQSFFGKLEIERFIPRWSVDEAVNCACRLQARGETVRYSIFPKGISCHSQSNILPEFTSRDQMREALSKLDQGVTIEMFPQQSADQMCFRAVMSQGDLLVEVGWGQAMYVFENERGKHDIIVARFQLNAERWELSKSATTTGRLGPALQSFVNIYGRWLVAGMSFAGRRLGASTFGIEGYFNDRSNSRPVIVDIDLPTDFAWN